MSAKHRGRHVADLIKRVDEDGDTVYSLTVSQATVNGMVDMVFGRLVTYLAVGAGLTLTVVLMMEVV